MFPHMMRPRKEIEKKKDALFSMELKFHTLKEDKMNFEFYLFSVAWIKLNNLWENKDYRKIEKRQQRWRCCCTPNCDVKGTIFSTIQIQICTRQLSAPHLCICLRWIFHICILKYGYRYNFRFFTTFGIHFCLHPQLLMYIAITFCIFSNFIYY